MKLNIGTYEVEVNITNSAFPNFTTEQVTKSVLNMLVLKLYKAADKYAEDGYEFLSKQICEEAGDLFAALDAEGYYDEVKTERAAG